MRKLRATLIRVLGLFRRNRLEAEMNAELRAHLDGLTERNIAKGMPPEEARYAAMREFGGLEQVKERARDERRSNWIDALGQDLRYAVRSLRKSPGFAAVAILILAVAIGANTALFSVIDSILLRPLPFPQPDQLTVVWETNAAQGVKREGPSGPNFYDWREQSRLFQDMAAIEIGTGTATGFGEPRQVSALRVTVNLFSLLNARPALGRLFVPEDGRGGRRNIMILSYDNWQRNGADPDIVGKTFLGDHIPYQVIGVLGRDFHLPVPSDVYVPWPDSELRLERGRLAHDLGVIGRLKPGATAAQAEAELNTVQARLRLAHPELTGWGVTVVPMQTVTGEYIRPALIALFCAVGFVLLIACANVANLLLARALKRGREVAVRAALGATRGRLVRQFLSESLVLSLVAGVLGALLAAWGVKVLSGVVPSTMPIPDAAADVTLPSFTINARALVFSLVVSLLTSLLFGLAPALHALKTDVIEGLKKSSRVAAGGGRRLREILLVAEIALALVLVTGAGLMLKSFSRLQHVDLGFRAAQVLSLEMELPTDTEYRTGPEQSAFFSHVLEQVGALPDVTDVGVTSVLPLHSQDQRARFLIENEAPLPLNERLQSDLRRVSASYFRTMRIPLKRGRPLSAQDVEKAPLVGVVDEAFARRFFGDSNPIGRRLMIEDARLEIVGVVGNVIHAGAAREPRPTLYVSFLQSPIARMNLVVRTAAIPASVVTSVKKAIWRVDAEQPVYRIETMDDVVSDANSAPRATLSLLGVFAIVAIGLAATGIFGVMAYVVSQQTNELGIRLALGASPQRLVMQVMRHGMVLVVVGLTVGLAAVFILGRFAESILYHTSPYDPVALSVTGALLAAVAFLACLIPACRAAKIDPMVAMRAE